MSKAAKVQEEIQRRLAGRRGEVFLRTDFLDLGSYDQVGRILTRLVRAGKLIRIGHGLYAKARPSRLTGKPVPRVGLRTVAEETLERLGYRPHLSNAERRYNAGGQQVPTGRVIGVDRRVKRRISILGHDFSFERKS